MPKRVYDRAYASFRLFGHSLDPLDVTLLLKLPPDHTHRAGEPRLIRTRAGCVEERSPYEFGMWSMSSEKWVNSPSLSVHLEWLLEQLEPIAAELKTIRKGDVKADFFCYSSGTTDTPPSLPRTIRDRAADLDIAIEIDHYHLPANQKAK